VPASGAGRRGVERGARISGRAVTSGDAAAGVVLPVERRGRHTDPRAEFAPAHPRAAPGGHGVPQHQRGEALNLDGGDGDLGTAGIVGTSRQRGEFGGAPGQSAGRI
jgi:hypothetical protein